MARTIVGASVWEQDLYDYLTSHLDNEREIVTSYREVAESDSSPAFRYLANLILEDEERHHRLMANLAEAVASAADLSPGEHAVPALRGLERDHDRVLALTDQFLAIEREDLADLKQLRKKLKEVEDTTLWGMLVQMMQDDTEKHIRMLTFVRDRVRKAH